MTFLQKMMKVLKGNDPAQDVGALRTMALHKRIMDSVQATPQGNAPRPHYPLQRLNSGFGWARGLALGVSVLVLGVWVGQSIDRGSTNQVAVAQAQNEQHISVVAMVTPWEGWIEGGE